MEDFNSKYSGEQVEALLDQVASGNAGGGGGGGITVEADPIFKASPAATITVEKIAAWDAKSEQGEQGEKGDKGDTGVGVQSVAQTTTSNADGGSNVVTVTLTDGTKSTFTVKNGSKGSQGIQGEQGPKGDTGATGAKGDKGDTGAAGTNGTNGKDGADGATFTPSVDSAGNLSWTNNKGLTNPPTVNIKGPKGDAGEGGGGAVGKEVVQVGSGVIELLESNKLYILSSPNYYYEISELPYESGNYAEYHVIINAINEMMGEHEDSPITLVLPEGVSWANGAIPDISKQGQYELSIVYFASVNWSDYLAVLTPFKPI